MKSVAAGLVFLLILPMLWWNTARAADPPGSSIDEERSKQEAIYHSKGDQVPEGYTIDRSLQDYIQALPEGFDTALEGLRAEDQWLDIGAGKALAILDYYNPDPDPLQPEDSRQRKRKARAVAISIEDRRTSLWQKTAANLEANQIRYFVNKRLRDFSPEELGRFQVITDVMGGFSYTNDLTLFMEKVLDFLAPNGSFFTLLQDIHSEAGTNRPYYANSPFLTEIANADGSELKMCAWLKSISCVAVACELKPNWKPPVETYRVRKTCSGVSVPRLELVDFQAGTPPQRRFRKQSRPPATPVAQPRP